MLATITKLFYWKSEHDAQSCEDAFELDPAAGLFAVADGVGTAFFSNIWAKIMVKHFIKVPLMSDDPFEVEWWLRQAQEEYKRQAPEPLTLPLGARKKAQEGSYTTLVTLRLFEIEAEVISAELRAFGDSCVLVQPAQGKRTLSFPLEKPSDFERGPICLPSYLKRFDRNFTRCISRPITFEPGDRVILATDAVSKWIINGGGRGEQFFQDAFEQVAQQTDQTWPEFIAACRANGQMVDDDVTALVITFHLDEARQGEILGTTTTYELPFIEDRRKAFADAQQRHDKEQMAVFFGDGRVFGVESNEIPQEIRDARAVADAMNEVLQALRSAVNSPDLAQILGPVWKKHQALLEHEPGAQEIIDSLRQNGVIASPSQKPLLDNDLLRNIPAPVPGPITPAEQHSVPPPASISPQSIRQADLGAGLTDEQLELLSKFWRAYRINDDEQIALAYEAILRSPYREGIILVEEEEQRAIRALSNVRSEQRLRAMTEQSSSSSDATILQTERLQPTMQQWGRAEGGAGIVGSVNGRLITEAMVAHLSALKDWYITFRNLQLGNRLVRNRDDKPLINLEQEDLRIVGRQYPLGILMDDCLIQEGIEAGVWEHKLNSKDWNFQPKAREEFSEFYRYHQGKLPPELERLDQEEICEALLVFIRRRTFARYIWQQQKKRLSSWLDKKGDQAIIKDNSIMQ